MGAVILTVIKIIGIVLLVILGLLILLAGILLFVPVRYRIRLQKGATDEWKAAHAVIRVTWLLHLLNVSFCYPERAYVRVRILFFTIFRSDRPKKAKSPKNKPPRETVRKDASKEELLQKEAYATQETDPAKKDSDGNEAAQEHKQNEQPQEINEKEVCEKEKEEEKHKKKTGKRSLKVRFRRIAGRVWDILKNIRYTIRKIYDKIVDIIRNIRYYTEILKSELFKETLKKCSGELWGLIKSIAPRKIKGWLHIGMEDPATTGKLMGYYGMLYPLIGKQLDVIPDFDEVVFEGVVRIKGRITLFRAIKTGIVIYFNKDLQKLIRLCKREETE